MGIVATVVVGIFTGGEGTVPAALLLIMGSAIALVIGVIVGTIQRPGVQRRMAIAQENERFLANIGFNETGESEITHYDQEGNGLRVIERTSDSIVFMAVGKRNKRAYIGLSADGTMTGYTGIIPIGAPRVFLSNEKAA